LLANIFQGLHVEALYARIPASSYVAHSSGPTRTYWESINEMVAKLFREAVEKCLIKNNGSAKRVVKVLAF
jgi:hypothetical protein